MYMEKYRNQMNNEKKKKKKTNSSSIELRVPAPERTSVWGEKKRKKEKRGSVGRKKRKIKYKMFSAEFKYIFIYLIYHI